MKLQNGLWMGYERNHKRYPYLNEYIFNNKFLIKFNRRYCRESNEQYWLSNNLYSDICYYSDYIRSIKMTIYETTEELRKPKEGKIKPGEHWSNWIKGQFNLQSHDISLMSATPNDTTETIWHEFMHKVLWEDPEIPEDATRAFDDIAAEISKYLELPHDWAANWKGLRELRKDLKL